MDRDSVWCRNDRRSWLKKIGSCLNLDAELMARKTREQTLIVKIKRRLLNKEQYIYTPVKIPGEAPPQLDVPETKGSLFFKGVS